MSKEVKVHEGELEIVAGSKSMGHCVLEVRADPLLDPREHDFIDEMGHVSGDVPLGIAEESDEKHVGVDERIVVRVAKATRRKEMKQIRQRRDVQRGPQQRLHVGIGVVLHA